MRSVEFLAIFTLLIIFYSILYSHYASTAARVREKIEELDEEIKAMEVNSLISAMCAYGRPFEYQGDLPIVPVSALCKAGFDRGIGKYTYETCGRV